jgi:hypothetical protein
MQMLVGLDGRRMIAVFPKCAMPVLALIVLLRGSARDELHALRDNVSACVFHQQMNMVACHHIVQYAETESLLCFKDPMHIPATIAGKL